MCIEGLTKLHEDLEFVCKVFCTVCTTKKFHSSLDSLYCAGQQLHIYPLKQVKCTIPTAFGHSLLQPKLHYEYTRGLQ